MVVSADLAAQLATRCNHANLVRILGVHHSGGAAQLMVEQIAGRSLQAMIDAAREPLPLAVALTIARDLARGLFFLHQLTDGKGRSLQLVHGGLTPATIVIGYDGVARIGGLERLAATAGKPPPAPDWAAPEQLAEPELDGFDRRVDTFALGAILLRMLTGLRLHDSALPVPSSADIPYCPGPFEQVLRKALARDPERRFDSAEGLRAAIEGFAVRDGRSLDNHEVGKLVRSLLPEHLPEPEPVVIPPRPDRSLWGGDSKRWAPVAQSSLGAGHAAAHETVEARPSVNRYRVAEPNALVPAASAVAQTLAVAALDDDGQPQLTADTAAVLDDLSADLESGPPLPPPPGGMLAQPPLAGPMPLPMPMPAPMPMGSPGAYRPPLPPAPYPAPGMPPSGRGGTMMGLPPPPSPERFRWLPTRSVAGTIALLLLLFAAAVAIAYLASA